MIALTETLIAAQRSPGAAPALRVTVADRDVGVARLRFARWYTGAEADGPCGAAMPADGSLIRARIDAGTGALAVQRVVAPEASSAYGVWTALGTVVASARLGCHAAGARVLIATVRTGGTQIEVRESADSGATFGASALVATAVGTVSAVACAVRTDGSAAVCWATGGVVYSSRRSGLGAWGAPAAWSNALAGVSAIAMGDASDYAVMVSGAAASGTQGVWTTRLGSGLAAPPGAWLPLTEVAAAASGTTVTYLATGVGEAGSARVAFLEVFAGIGAYSRAQIAHAIATTAFDDQLWRSPEPMAITSTYGLAFAGGGGHAFLCAPAGVWHASSDAPATDLSADVVEAHLHEQATAASLRLRLRNDGARYAPGASPAGLAPGGELAFEPGCTTAEGAEHASGRRYTVTAVRRVRVDGAAYVEVEAEGPWDALAAWRAPRQFTWAAGAASAYTVLREIARRAGLLLFSSGASAEATLLAPAYAVRAGERGDRAFARLLERLPDQVRALGAFMTLTEPSALEAATYAYGQEHAVASLRTVDERRAAGWARVFGANAFAEAVDAASAGGGAGAVIVVDDNLTSTARAIARADAVLRRATLARDAGELVASPHVGQEVGDVIEVTDAGLGVTAQPFRVTSVRFDYVFGGRRGRASMTLGLGEV